MVLLIPLGLLLPAIAVDHAVGPGPILKLIKGHRFWAAVLVSVLPMTGMLISLHQNTAEAHWLIKAMAALGSVYLALAWPAVLSLAYFALASHLFTGQPHVVQVMERKPGRRWLILGAFALIVICLSNAAMLSERARLQITPVTDPAAQGQVQRYDVEIGL